MDITGVVTYASGFAITAGIYGIFSLGLNVHWGYTGLMNFGIAGFFALGAYTSVLITSPSPDPRLLDEFKFGGDLPERLGALNLGIDLWFVVALMAAGVACAIFAVIIGVITLRLRGDYLAIASLGAAETVRLMFLNEEWLANGSRGMFRIPRFLGDLVSPSNYDYFYLGVVLVVLAALYLIVNTATRSSWGDKLRMVRAGEAAAIANGLNVFSLKLQSFVLGAVIMGIGGALFAHDVRFVAPNSFDPFLATFVIWAMLVIGGAGNNQGAVAGAIVVWGIWIGLKFLPGYLADSNFRIFMVGLLILTAVIARPVEYLSRTHRQSNSSNQTYDSAPTETPPGP